MPGDYDVVHVTDQGTTTSVATNPPRTSVAVAQRGPQGVPGEPGADGVTPDLSVIEADIAALQELSGQLVTAIEGLGTTVDGLNTQVGDLSTALDGALDDIADLQAVQWNWKTDSAPDFSLTYAGGALLGFGAIPWAGPAWLSIDGDGFIDNIPDGVYACTLRGAYSVASAAIAGWRQPYFFNQVGGQYYGYGPAYYHDPAYGAVPTLSWQFEYVQSAGASSFFGLLDIAGSIGPVTLDFRRHGPGPFVAP